MKTGPRNEPQKQVQGTIHENRFKELYTKTGSRNDTQKRFKESSTQTGSRNDAWKPVQGTM
jgi:hypothetical protein